MKKDDFLSLLKAMNIDSNQIEKIALACGFLIRKSLVAPCDILYAICCQSTQGTVSFNDLAAKIDAESAVSVSRQAIGKKMNKQSCIDFLKKILSLVIMSKIDKEAIGSLRQGCKYKRILVQDSTIVGLPIRLFDVFSGVSNAHVSVCNARIQCVYDLISESFICFTIDPYSKNDLKAAPELCLEQGDLVIRDRGYLTCNEIERHLELGADCIFRHKHDMVFLDVQTDEKIDLLASLKTNKQLDLMVTLNDKNRTMVRIVAFPVSEEIANIRRMKAKKEKKKEPSKAYLELLSWSIFITTITLQEADYDFIFKAYSLRWRIEIIFKSWKSNMEFSKIHNVSKTQLSIILFARFIMIIICIQYIFSPARMIIIKHLEKFLSMLKVVRYLIKNPTKIISIVKELSNYKEKINYHMCFSQILYL
jgi:hypothetical protein